MNEKDEGEHGGLKPVPYVTGDLDVDMAIEAKRPIHKDADGRPYCGRKEGWMTVTHPRWLHVSCKLCWRKAWKERPRSAKRFLKNLGDL